MWGGVKKRTQHADLFRRWSGTRGVDELRTALYKEPRPWYIAFTLDSYNNLLQDRHCARLLSWSASIVELRPTLAAKQEAYRYSQEMFQLLMSHHKVGRETLGEFMRLCAVGADLTSAFDWFKYWQEAQLDDHDALSTLTWLLVVAQATPGDERVEDLALTVLEVYTARFTEAKGGAGSSGHGSHTAAPSPSLSPSSSTLSLAGPANDLLLPDQTESRRHFLAAFKALEPRLQHNATLTAFLATVPFTVAEASAYCADAGWPCESPHRLFPQLDQHRWPDSSADGLASDTDAALYRSATTDKLRDSLLHSDFVAKLERAASQSSVAEVVALVEAYERQVQREKAKTAGDRTVALRKRSGEGDLWHHYTDPSAVAFRHRPVQEGGVTPELYHYLISALVATQPSAALRTLAGMEDADVRPLDRTRAAVLVAVKDSKDDQRRLFQQQLSEIDGRAQLDADRDTFTIVEAYWKCNYVEFFHYRNALDKAQFYLYLMMRLGPQAVQQLLLDTQTHGPLATKEDLVLLDDDLRQACRVYFRSRVGRAPVQAALDAISTAFPKLDISLVGTIAHFENYFMAESDAIAHSEEALKALLEPYDAIYVMDASFIETSESFLRVGATAAVAGEGGEAQRSLVLIPHIALAQLGASVTSTSRFVSFDPALQQAIRAEPFLASQRLRALFAMLTTPTAEGEGSGSVSRRMRLLHFTECLCAHQIDPSVLAEHRLSPATRDNDHLLLVVAMLSCLKPAAARLVLCADDDRLVSALAGLQGSSLFGAAVEVVSTSPPSNLDVEHNLIDDNPVLQGELWESNSEGEFRPRLTVAADCLPPTDSDGPQWSSVAGGKACSEVQDSTNASAADATGDLGKEEEEATQSPWLALLDDDESSSGVSTTAAVASTTAATAPTPPPQTASALSGSSSSSAAVAATAAVSENAEAQALQERLMDLYETPYDVVPVGQRMKAASALGSVFSEFDTMDPEERAAREADRAAAASQLSSNSTAEDTPGGGRPQQQQQHHRRRRSVLEREMLSNRGFSNKDRFRMARKLSNRSGARVPFNMRYRVVEANIRDPRNAHLRKVFQEGVAKQRSHFKRHNG